MSTSLYYPLLVVGLAYAALSIAAGVVTRRGDADKGERYRDAAFGTALAAAVYTAVLLILSAVDTPSRFEDMLLIFAVIFVFFALLLLLLLFFAQVVSRLRRRPER
jgi:cytochrome bd-type quinol oxidase subunit 2